MGRKARFSAVAALLTALVVCGAVTVLRAFQPAIAATPLLVGFAPLTIPVYAVAAGLLLLGWPLGGLRVRPALALAAMGGLAVHLMWLLPTYAPEDGYRPDAAGAADGSAPEQTVTVMTINVLKGRAEPQAVQRLVARVRPDVLVLSEVSGPFAAALADGAITDLPRVAGDADDATLILSSLPVAGPAEELPAGLGWRIPLEAGGGEVQVLGVHPSAPHLSTTAWWRDHAALRQATEAASGPSIIAGDLNATLDHGPVIDLQEAGFSDAARTAGLGWAPTWPANGRPVPVPLLALDHVMARGPWILTDVGRQDLPRTDHQAVWATWQSDASRG